MDVRSPLTVEYVRVSVGAVVEGAAINPTADTVNMAVVPTGTLPDTPDWKAATWETDASTDPDTYYAKLLVGPAPGVVTLTAGRIYDVYVRVTDNPEIVVRRDGALAAL